MATERGSWIGGGTAPTPHPSFIEQLAGPGGASLVGFVQAGSGAVSRTVQEKGREWVSAKDFGAAGNGIADDSVAIQRAIDALPASGGDVQLIGSSRISTPLSLRSGVVLRGRGSQSTILTYTGVSQAIKQLTPGTRIFGAGVCGVRINDIGSGTIGLDMNSLSSGEFDDVVVNGFATGVSLTGANGDCVYNRFHNVTAQNATTGFVVGADGSNSNSFLACRVNIATTGFDVADSNQNQIAFSQIENCTTGVRVSASVNAISDRNTLAFNRFEGCTTNYDITSSNVRYTVAVGNHHIGGTPADSGFQSMLLDMMGTSGPNLLLQSNNTASASGNMRLVRTTQGGASLPFLVVRDDNSAGGTPITLQIETERSAGKFLSGKRAGVEYVYIDAQGRMQLASGLGLFGGAPVTAKPTATGSRGGNAALASLLTALASYGLITDGTSA